jgi:hypothetical protein
LCTVNGFVDDFGNALGIIELPVTEAVKRAPTSEKILSRSRIT